MLNIMKVIKGWFGRKLLAMRDDFIFKNILPFNNLYVYYQLLNLSYNFLCFHLTQFLGIIHSMCFLSNYIFWLIFIVPKTVLFILYLLSTHL